MSKLETQWYTAPAFSAVDNPKGSQAHHKQVILQVLEDIDRPEGVQISEIQEQYSEEVKDPRSKRTILRYLTEMIDEGKVKWRGATNTRKYRKT